MGRNRGKQNGKAPAKAPTAGKPASGADGAASTVQESAGTGTATAQGNQPDGNAATTAPDSGNGTGGGVESKGVSDGQTAQAKPDDQQAGAAQGAGDPNGQAGGGEPAVLDDQGENDLPRYRSHKIVGALKLSDIELNNDTGAVRLTPEDKRFAPFNALPSWYARFTGGVGKAPVDLPCVSWVLFARDNNTGNAQAQKQFEQALAGLESTGKRVVVEASHVGDDFNDLAQGEE